MDAAIRDRGASERREIDGSLLAGVLEELGGSAHLAMIHARLRTRLAEAGRPAPGTLGELAALLRRHADEAFGSSLFYQPFGPDSLRWSLRRDPQPALIAAA